MNTLDAMTKEKDKRTLILYGAMKVFSRKGFHEAKVEEIAQEAGVGKGTVYEYFASKENLFKEMVQAGLRHFHNSVADEVANAQSTQEKLYKIFIVYYNFFEKHKDTMSLFMEAQRGIKEDFHQVMLNERKELIHLLEGIFQQAIEAGEFRKLNAKLAAQLYLGAIKELITSSLCGEGTDDPRKTFEEALSLMLTGLEKRD